MATAKTGPDLYQYTPSIVAAAIFIVIFAVLTILHTYRLIRTRLWFCLPFTVGGICTLFPCWRLAGSLSLSMQQSTRLTE